MLQSQLRSSVLSALRKAAIGAGCVCLVLCSSAEAQELQLRHRSELRSPYTFPTSTFHGTWELSLENTYLRCAPSQTDRLIFEIAPASLLYPVQIEAPFYGSVVVTVAGFVEGSLSLFEGTDPKISFKGKLRAGTFTGEGTWFNNYGCGGTWTATRTAMRTITQE